MDYLELLAGGGDALLLALSRLEGIVPGPSAPDGGGESEGTSPRPAGEVPGTGESARPAERSGGAEQSAGERLPLMEELERLARAAVLTELPGAQRRGWGGAALSAPGRSPGPFASPVAPASGGAWPDLWGERPGGVAPWPDWERSGTPAAGELRWTEQVDRDFRRDSRRYDGGFYLY